MNENIVDRKSLISFITGTDSEGKDTTTTTTISNIRLDTTEDQLGNSQKNMSLLQVIPI